MIKTIYLAGGCFWGLQKYISLIKGITKTEVGYANGTTASTTYEQVCTGSGHAETVRVEYDENVITLTRLLDLYADVVDPTSVNWQGGDVGVQYRTGIYYENESDRVIVAGWLVLLGESLTGSVAVEFAPLENFCLAEDYHQDYLDKNPDGYCHISNDKLECAANAVHGLKNDKLREKLTPLQYEVTIGGATEPPFENEYYNNFEAGIYVDVIDGKPLFVSTDKFESGCGWPAFSRPIDESLVRKLTDDSYGRHRMEVRAGGSDAHLGHVFNDGKPELGGLRYCINSASLRFVPKEDMEGEGYGEYLKFVK